MKRQWRLLALAVVLAPVLFFYRGSTEYREGATIEVEITLITADAFDLICALDREVSGHHCAHVRPGERWSGGGNEVLLKPYSTHGGDLLLIPGLFSEPAVRARFAEELPAGKKRDQLRRFSARCKMTLVERVEGVHARNPRTPTWQEPRAGWMGRVSSCLVHD